MSLPDRDREYLQGKQILFEEVTEGGQRAVIFKDRPLPSEQYDAGRADVLVILPGNYDDAPPDMFYTLPWLKLRRTGQYPTKADVPQTFVSKSWQRWSRHNNEWRAGIDGIWTVLQRIDTALRVAA